MTTHRFLNPFLCLCLMGLLAVPLPATLAAPADTPAQVVVGGTLIHVIRTTWGGLTPQQRADQVQQRLITALAQGPISAKDIAAGQMQGDWCVLVRGQRFLTADQMSADQQHSTPETLADEWAMRLQQVLPDLTGPHHG